jgi:serine O-acetyltransferase
MSEIGGTMECCAGDRRYRIRRRSVADAVLAPLRRRLDAAATALGELAFVARDFRAMLDRDPALGRDFAGFLSALSYAGFWALLSYRIAHLLRAAGMIVLPRFFQATARLLTGVDIHPGARIGAGLFIDHGMGTVIGETAEIGDDVTLLHQVTLGARGGRGRGGSGKRHPTLGDRVVVGAGAKVLGPVTVGDDALIGANAVILEDVPEGATAVGIPGRIVARRGCA